MDLNQQHLLIGLIVTVVAPLILKFVPLNDWKMRYFTLAVSVVIALFVEAQSGMFQNIGTAVSTPEKLAILVAASWGATKLVYEAFKSVNPKLVQ
jgi:hypothetical protein